MTQEFFTREFYAQILKEARDLYVEFKNGKTDSDTIKRLKDLYLDLITVGAGMNLTLGEKRLVTKMRKDIA